MKEVLTKQILSRFNKRSFIVYYDKVNYSKDSCSCSKPEIKGLSEACLKVPDEPVGPCAGKDQKYKNPEYFCYHRYTFYQALVELKKYRCDEAPSKPKCDC